MKKLLLTALLALSLTGGCYARTTESVSAEEGLDPYHGFVVADMSMEDGVVSQTASYSMKIYRDYGLVPVAYCSSGGSRLGTYYTFFVNPYHDSLIVGNKGFAPHSAVFQSKDLVPFELSGKMISATDMLPHQDLYRKIIRVAKAEFEKYPAML